MRAVIALIFLCVAFPAPAQVRDDSQKEQLKAQVEDLEARLKDVEGRLARIEKNTKSMPALGAVALPIEKQRWRGLSKSMSREQVRQLLGEPLRVEGGAFEYWYYGRGSVTFYKNVVNSWREP